MLTVAGEALIDLVVDESGSVTAYPGGGPFNVARISGRLGARCQFLGRLSCDAFGRRLRVQLERAQVGLVVPRPTNAPTTLAVAELDADGVAGYRFHLRGTSAADLRPRDIPAGALDGTMALAFGGLGIVAEPVSTTLVELVRGAPASTTVLLDLNSRPQAIYDPDSYGELVRGLLARADIVKASLEDLEVLGVTASGLLELGAPAVVVTAGAEPVTLHTARGRRAVAVEPVEVVDTVGAGDAFVAGLLTWWTRGELTRERATDVEALARAATAGVAVARAACTVAGANLPDGWRWPEQIAG